MNLKLKLMLKREKLRGNEAFAKVVGTHLSTVDKAEKVSNQLLEEVFSCISKFSLDIMGYLDESGVLLSDAQRRNLFLWMAALHSQMVDRWLFEELGSNARNSIMKEFDNALAAMLAELIGRLWKVKSNEEELFLITKNSLDAKVTYLGQFAYKIFQEEGESIKGTLLWEFNKALNKDIGIGVGDMAYVSHRFVFYMGILNPIVRRLIKL